MNKPEDRNSMKEDQINDCVDVGNYISRKLKAKSIDKIGLVKKFTGRKIPHIRCAEEYIECKPNRKIRKTIGKDKLTLHVHPNGLTEEEFKLIESLAYKNVRVYARLYFSVCHELTLNSAVVNYLKKTFD